jgi:hypothetical protein
MAGKSGKSGGIGWITGAWLVALAATAGYSAWWFTLARAIERQVPQSLQGIGSVEGVSVTGWPYRLSVRLRNADLALPGGVRIRAARLGATTTPFSPRFWVLDMPDNVTLAIAGGPDRQLAPDGLKASLRLRDSGIERLSVVFDGLAAAPAVPGDPGWSAGKGFFHVIHDPQHPERYALALDVRELRMSRGLEGPAAILGDTIRHLRAVGPVDNADALSTSLSAWQAAGGTFQVMDGELFWGPLTFDGVQGSLRLGPDGLPSGTLAGTGALKPEGVQMPALSAPVSAEVRSGRLEVFGLSVAALPGASR